MTDIPLSYEAQTLRHRVFRTMSRGADAPQPNVYRGYLPLPSQAEDALEEYRAEFMTFMTSHWEGLSETFRLLEDTASRDLFINLLAFRAAGQNHLDLFPDREFYFASLRHANNIPSAPSRFAEFPGGGSIRQFDLEIGRAHHTIECLPDNIFFSFMLRQYFFRRDGIEIKPDPGDHAVDAGSCFGDTALNFSEAVGPAGHVYSFDPLALHLRIMKANLDRNGIDNVTVFPMGLGEHNADGVPVTNQINPGFSAMSQGARIPVCSLDRLVEDRCLDKIDFIKMDIEGHELAALRGAEATIRRFQPKLAISLYHNFRDYIEIPRYISGLSVGYNFYLENYTVSDGETVLYCTVDSRSINAKQAWASGDQTEPIPRLDAVLRLDEALDQAEQRVRRIVARQTKARHGLPPG